MKLLRPALIGVVLAFACFAKISSAKTQEFQKVTFDELFAKQVASLPLALEIPSQYVHAEGLAVPSSTYSYWMQAGEVARAARSKDLPVKTGYIYGKLSPNETYDQTSDKFLSEDQAEAQLAAAGMVLLERKRFLAKGYPVFAYIVRAKNGAVVCSMFVAMLIDTNVLYISYRPPSDDLKTGRAVWSHMLDSLTGPYVTANNASAHAGLTSAEIKTLPPSRIEAALPSEHPASFYLYAGRLFSEGKKDEAVLWFYIGQLRYRIYLKATPSSDPSGDPALFSSLNATLGEQINKYAGGNTKMWAAQITSALNWDDNHPNNFTPKDKYKDAHAEIRAGLVDLRKHVEDDKFIAGLKMTQAQRDERAAQVDSEYTTKLSQLNQRDPVKDADAAFESGACGFLPTVINGDLFSGLSPSWRNPVVRPDNPAIVSKSELLSGLQLLVSKNQNADREKSVGYSGINVKFDDACWRYRTKFNREMYRRIEEQNNIPPTQVYGPGG